jgi:hypothetical protein
MHKQEFLCWFVSCKPQKIETNGQLTGASVPMMNSPPCILTMLLVRGKSGGRATFSLSEYLCAPSCGLPSDAARLDEQPQEVFDLTTQKEDDIFNKLAGFKANQIPNLKLS